MKKRLSAIKSWLESNAHLFSEQVAKDAYAEVLTYLEAAKSGDLTDEQSERLAGRIQSGLVVLAVFLTTRRIKSKRLGALLNALPFLSGTGDGNKALAQQLQKIFKQAPKVTRAASRAKSKVQKLIK